MSTTIRHDVQG